MNRVALARPSLLLFAAPALGACALALSQSALAAAVLTWPNLTPSGPCLGTLQACIDEAAPGDIVQIGADDFLFPDRYTAINENLAINKSLTLRAAKGIDAVFVAGRNITINPPNVASLSYTIAVEGIILDRGTIDIHDNEYTGSSYRVENVRFNDLAADATAINMQSEFNTHPDFQILHNVIRVHSAGALTKAIVLNQNGPTAAITVAENRIEAPDGAILSAIAVLTGGGGPVTVSGNTVVSRRLNTGIEVRQGETTLGTANVFVINNSISGPPSPSTPFFGAAMWLQLSNADVHVINNTLIQGSSGLYFYPIGAAPTVTGLVANNLIALNSGYGIYVGAGYAAVTNRNNLLFGNGPNIGFVPGPGTVTSDPLLYSPTYPRPGDASPAIEAGSNSALPALDLFDADGQPRIMLGNVDIGAYEAGYAITGVHKATGSNSEFNVTVVPALEGTPLVPSDKLVATALHTAGAALGLAQNLGIYLLAPTGPLSIFHEDGATGMTSGRRFAVTVPAFGLAGYTHATTGANVINQYTALSNAALDGQSGAIAVVTHNYFQAGPYHNHPIALEYSGGVWYLRNEDTSDMLSGRNFNVAIAPALSENAFRVSAVGSASEIEIVHPLLDDNACAAPIVGRVNSPGPVVLNATSFSLDYRAGTAGAPGRWYVLAEGGGAPASFPSGAAFNVIIDGEQANRCRDPDRIFADGLE